MNQLIIKLLIFKCIILFITKPILGSEYDENNEEYSIQYTSEEFIKEVPKQNHFIMFYAPWCGHCKRLHPTWEKLAEMLNSQDESTVIIGKVDCTVNTGICTKHDITGYPTLKYFEKDSAEGVKYRGTRDIPSLASFINSQLDEPIILEANNDSPKVKEEVKLPESVNGLTELTEDTFEKFISKGRHFIKFYAPWCGHCQKLAPTWEQLAKILERESYFSISKVDCTLYKSVCNLFDVKGYPTLLYIEDGKKIDKYQGTRSLEDLKDYIVKMGGDRKEIDTDDDSVEDELKTTKQEQAPVVLFTGSNFEHGIENDVSLVKFFAPWCGHCKRLAPTWDELALKFIKNSKVSIAKVDCTETDNKQLCAEQEVDGFPTIFLYKNGQKMSEYTGSRSLDDLYSFVLKYAEDHDEL